MWVWQRGHGGNGRTDARAATSHEGVPARAAAHETILPLAVLDWFGHFFGLFLGVGRLVSLNMVSNSVRIFSDGWGDCSSAFK